MKKGQIFKIHSDFYYIRSIDDDKVYECKAREILKKQKIKILTGDIVEFENNFIERVLPRRNFIPRPAVANVDQIIIVSALDNPDFMQLDRYIAFAAYYEIPVKLCFNKDDIEHGQIAPFYGHYDCAITSAVEHTGLEKFTGFLRGKTSVLCGNSGVGKSSLINALNPNLKLKTGKVSDRTNRGTHTTRHCEIVDVTDDIKIIDTPGFSHLKFDFLMPIEVSNLFEEFPTGCKFSDCLHINETGCAVRDNVDGSRYASYLAFVEEAKSYKKKVKFEGTKIESAQKSTGGDGRVKISDVKRAAARNTQKQKDYKNAEID
jgi:ribosome biogenesis GTPase